MTRKQIQLRYVHLLGAVEELHQEACLSPRAADQARKELCFAADSDGFICEKFGTNQWLVTDVSSQAKDPE
jgi:hypothetical protein